MRIVFQFDMAYSILSVQVELPPVFLLIHRTDVTLKSECPRYAGWDLNQFWQCLFHLAGCKARLLEVCKVK